MNEVHKDTPVDAEYKEMHTKVEASEEFQSAEQEDAVTTDAQVVISVMSNGALDVSAPEGMPQLQPIEVERLVRQVADEMRDMRVANSAIEIFKQRLG